MAAGAEQPLSGPGIDGLVRAVSLTDLTVPPPTAKAAPVLLACGVFALASAAAAGLYTVSEIADPPDPPPVQSVAVSSAPVPAKAVAPAPRPEPVLVARIPRPRPDEPITTGSIDAAPAASDLPADGGVPGSWYEADSRKIYRLSTIAASIAESSPECDGVARSRVSGEHSAPTDQIAIIIQCGNGIRFLFTRADIEANAPTQANAGPGTANDMDAACAALNGLPFPFPVRCVPGGYGVPVPALVAR